MFAAAAKRVAVAAEQNVPDEQSTPADADVCQALSCEAAALLGGHPPEVQAALQAYGRHLGIAYQVPKLGLGLGLERKEASPTRCASSE